MQNKQTLLSNNNSVKKHKNTEKTLFIFQFIIIIVYSTREDLSRVFAKKGGNLRERGKDWCVQGRGDLGRGCEYGIIKCSLPFETSERKRKCQIEALPPPNEPRRTNIGAAPSPLHLALSLLKGENDGIRSVRRPLSETYPPSRKVTKDRRIGAEFWDIESLIRTCPPLERAKAN